MKKNPHSSVDGLVSRRPRAVIGQAATHPTIGSTARPQLGQSIPQRRIQQSSGGQTIKNEIAESLQAIDGEDKVVPPKRRRLFWKKVEQKPKSPRRKRIKRIAIALAILVLVITGYFGWRFIHAGGQVFGGNLLGVLQKQRLKEDANGRTNILIFGTSGWSMGGDDWDGAMLTDSIMVVSVDQDDNNAYTVSLPRDLYVGTCTGSGKLNEVYWCAQQAGKSDEEAAAAFQQVAGEVTGLDVQYYVHANWQAFVQGVDAVGGVDVKIQGTSGEGIYDVATKVKYEEGEIAHLNGERALALARARGSAGGYGLDGSNFAREMNQQRILAALQKKATSASTLANPVAVSNLIGALGDNLRTNFQTSEIQALIDVAKNNEKITSLPMVDRPDDEPDLMTTGMFNGVSVVLPAAGQGDYSDIQAYIKKSILGSSVATIDVLNGSGLSGHAQEKANELEAAGYIIGTVDNAPSDVTEKVIIYQLSEDKTSAADKLKSTYGVSITKGAPEGYTPSDGADFVIVFGAG